MHTSRQHDVEALLAGRLTLVEVAQRHGVTTAELSEWLSLYQAGRRAQRRRAGLVAAALAFGAVGLFGATDAWAQAMCTPALPAGFTTFCPDTPALASQVNGNFLALLTYVEQRIGPASAGQVTTPKVGASSGTLEVQTTTAGATRFGGVVQLAGNATTNAVACTSATAGSLRLMNGALEVCQRGTWNAVLALPTTGGGTYTCKDILTANPGAPSGTYVVSAAGYAFQADCDMTSQGGGWTLAQGHAPAQRTIEGLRVVQNGGLYLPASAFRALAQAATQVRFTDGTTGSATSQVNSAALTQLRALAPVNGINTDAAQWTYTSPLSATNFSSSCGTGDVYPVTVHTCGNASGAHVYPGSHSLRSAALLESVGLWFR